MGILRKINFILRIVIQWTLSYIIFSMKRKKRPLHVLFCLADHFEPGTGGVNPEVEKERMEELLTKYPKIAKKHRDSHKNMPKRTWFFPPHYHRLNNIKKLVSLCEKGYGEVELHLHHGNINPDTPENLKKTILQCIDEYGRFGIFGMQNGEKKYGFIHGNWALDNSDGGKWCGVNNEIQILAQTGCYADFTFPSTTISNPKQINSIFYATDNPNKPKSHDRGEPVRKHGHKKGDLMIIQGPLEPSNIAGLHLPSDGITGTPPVNKKRLDLWIKTGIHIKGQTNWIIVKTHTHGVTDSEAVLGEEIENIFEHLETKYNDGHNYMLHYVTARELYNIIKAVEAGEDGIDPDEYRNYLIQKPSYNSTVNIPEASDELKNYLAKTCDLTPHKRSTS